jgi:hypothetical protein
MCKVAAALVGLAVGVGMPGLRAQNPRASVGGARALLARAESLQAQLARRDSLAGRAVYHQHLGRSFSAGDLTVVLAGTADAAVGNRVAARGVALLDTLGALPRGFVASRVVVAQSAAGVDSVLQAEGLSDRRRVEAFFGPRVDTLTAGFAVASALARAYRETLDTMWRSWGPADLALSWMEGRDGVAARRDLLAGGNAVGAQCLEGAVAQCGQWLGLDPEVHPFRVRYRPADLRRILAGRQWQYGPARQVARECVEGSDEACVQYAESGPFVDPVPAGLTARASLLRAVRVLHGASSLRSALADSSGSIGARLARAAGVSEDSLLAEWRTWLLTGGGKRRVSATLADGVPVAFFGALLLLAAARSGRWR